MATETEVVHAYRALYRALLQAVQYSAPARFVGRDQLRAAFRERGATWDPEGAKRTRWFLQAAARERGLEHRILKNLLRVRMRQHAVKAAWRRSLHGGQKGSQMKAEQETATRHYEMTIAMLNKSMGLCLR